MRKIKIFDTTLRDGVQSTEQQVGVLEREAILNNLIKLNVDVIEAGFAISGEIDFETIQKAAEKTKGTGIYVASLSTAKEESILASYNAVKNAEKRMIHTFVSTSDVHMREKLKKSPDGVYKMAIQAVRRSRALLDKKEDLVEFTPEDTTRTRLPFLAKVVRGVIKEGADVLNIADTVGYSQKGELSNIINYLKQHVPEIRKIQISVHNHDDLGQATANSLEGFLSGINQVECTINGVGERAGNASMEEIVAALKTREKFYKCHTEINTRHIGFISGLVSQLFKMPVQPNKAIVGANAFRHMSGIHQDGVSKNKGTYEIMNPEDYGWTGETFELTSSSGRAGFRSVLNLLGFVVSKEELDKVYGLGMEHAKKYNYLDRRVVACMLTDIVRELPKKYSINYMNVQSETGKLPFAEIKMNCEGKELISKISAQGPISALYAAIDEAINGNGRKTELSDFIIRSLGSGKDAIGETIVELNSFDGKKAYGWGLSDNIIESAASAYLSALNKI